MRKKLILPVLIIVIFIFIAIFIISGMLSRNTVNNTALTDEQRVEVTKPKAQQTLNKTFEFPLKDDKGIPVSNLKFVLQNAQLLDQIIVKGQRATAVTGRTFLILNIKITNSYIKPVSINSRDYIRLSVNNTDERLAPDIHNDPVEIQAISTKYTRLGFPINDTDKNLTLQIGEVTGKKEMIKLNLK